jgi:hypothetical protein
MNIKEAQAITHTLSEAWQDAWICVQHTSPRMQDRNEA